MSFRRFFLLAALLLPTLSRAEDYKSIVFPPAHELFPPLVADPSEPRFAFQGGGSVSHHGVAQVILGDYLGIYRWAFPTQTGAIQLNLGGVAINRFAATAAHSLQVIDFYGNVPLDVLLGPFSARFMFYHDSSHLGDDYLRENNIQSTDTSWEALRAILSIHPWKAFRFYGGYTHAIHTKPNWDGRDAIQGGMEVYFNNSELVHWHPYWGLDIQSWERTAWNPTYTAELGIKTGGQYSQGRGISYFMQLRAGPRYEGQFYTERETVWNVGLKFQLSQALAVPVPAKEVVPAVAAPPATIPPGAIPTGTP